MNCVSLLDPPSPTAVRSLLRSIPVQKNFPLAVMMIREVRGSELAVEITDVKSEIMVVVRVFPFLGLFRTIFKFTPDR